MPITVRRVATGALGNCRLVGHERVCVVHALVYRNLLSYLANKQVCIHSGVVNTRARRAYAPTNLRSQANWRYSDS